MSSERGTRQLPSHRSPLTAHRMPQFPPKSSSRSRASRSARAGSSTRCSAGEYRVGLPRPGHGVRRGPRLRAGRRFPHHRLERLRPARRALRQDLHRRARGHAVADGGPVGLDPGGRTGHQGSPIGRGGRGARAGRGAASTTGSARSSSPTRSSMWCRPPRVAATRSGVIRDLLAFSRERRGTNLVPAIRRTAQLLGHRSVVVILSDFLARRWDKRAPAARGPARSHRDHRGRSARDRPAQCGMGGDGRRGERPPGAGEYRERPRAQALETTAKRAGHSVPNVSVARGSSTSRSTSAPTTVWCSGGRSRGEAGARERGAGDASPLLLLVQAGTVTVGDTGLDRARRRPVGSAVIRPQPWAVGAIGQQLGPAEVHVGSAGALVRYALVLWYPGEHTLTMPGPVVVKRDGSSDTLAALECPGAGDERFAGGLPAHRAPASSGPYAGAARRSIADATRAAGRRWPARLCGGHAALAAAGPRPARRAQPSSRPDVSRSRHTQGWADAGEHRAALDGWGWILAKRMAESLDLEETARDSAGAR